MLQCEEQVNPIEYRGRQLRINDGWLNVHYAFCNLPVDATTVGMYTEFFFPESYEHPEWFSDAQLVAAVERGIMEEAINLIPEDELWKMRWSMIIRI